MRALSLVLSGLFLFTSLLYAREVEQPLSLLYISPKPAAQQVSPATSLAVRQGAPLDPRSIDQRLFTVVGNKSGVHRGSVRLSDDQRTLLFYPDQPFAYDEVVTVDIGRGLATADGRAIRGTSYQFSTATRAIRPEELAKLRELKGDWPLVDEAVASDEETQKPSSSQESHHYRTHPEFNDVMQLTVTSPATNTAEGLLFLAGIGAAFDPTLVIADDSAEPVFLDTESLDYILMDFKVQYVGGTPYLVYHHAPRSVAWSSGKWVVLDKHYRQVSEWTISNGHGADLHEFLLLNNGHGLMLSYVPTPWDLSPYGGSADAVILNIVIQQQDVNKNVVFEWRATDHLPLNDSVIPLDGSFADPYHTNAIEVDYDGGLLLSHRHLNEITKISRITGEVIWRLGGKGNQFTATNSNVWFKYQHDIRRLPNGNLTLYDNGNTKDPEYSRAVEYSIDERNKRVTLVWEHDADKSIFGPCTGNVQRLANGNSMIGWGCYPLLTEVTAAGAKALEISLPRNMTYRAYRFPWEGSPLEAPRLVVESSAETPDTSATLYFSWNGATGIESYEIYAGPTIDSLTLIDTVPRSGFETSTVLNGLDSNTCVFRVRPVHQDGGSTLFSHYSLRTDSPGCQANFAGLVFLPTVGR